MTVSFGQAAILVVILGDKVATEQFHLSIDAGVNLGFMSGFDDSKMGAGANYGLGAHIKLGEKWHLKPELKPISRKGARFVPEITEVPEDFIVEQYKLKVYYLDIPVLLQYNISPKFFVSAGPQISIVTDANQFAIGTLTDGRTSSIKVNAKSLMNKIAFSFPLEAGWALKLASKNSTTAINVNVFVRLDYGFTEIFKDTSLASTKITVIQVGASLPFIKTPEQIAQGKTK